MFNAIVAVVLLLAILFLISVAPRPTPVSFWVILTVDVIFLVANIIFAVLDFTGVF